MKTHIVELPHNLTMKIRYTDKVYSPKYSMVDTIVVADALIKKGQLTRVLDVACGTGVVGLGLKLLNPHIDLMMADVDPEAVRIAKVNARKLDLEALVFQNDLLDTLPPHQLITANLPTYDAEDMASNPLHGPKISYAAEPDDGISYYREFFKQAQTKAPFVVCECQAKHKDKFLELADQMGWQIIIETDYAFGFMRRFDSAKPRGVLLTE
jgi:methylase of polypeptide subunit release factors